MTSEPDRAEDAALEDRLEAFFAAAHHSAPVTDEPTGRGQRHPSAWADEPVVPTVIPPPPPPPADPLPQIDPTVAGTTLAAQLTTFGDQLRAQQRAIVETQLQTLGEQLRTQHRAVLEAIGALDARVLALEARAADDEGSPAAAVEGFRTELFEWLQAYVTWHDAQLGDLRMRVLELSQIVPPAVRPADPPPDSPRPRPRFSTD